MTGARYDVETRVTVGRRQLGILLPGVAVPVWVDPADPRRLAVDLRHGAQGNAGGASGGPPSGGTVHTPGGAFDVAGLQNDAVAEEVLSTDDVLARGISGEGEIRAATHTGATAQQMAPGDKLKAGEHDDPMVRLTMLVTPDNGASIQLQAIVRAPDGMLEPLTIGRKAPAAIDWKKLRYYKS